MSFEQIKDIEDKKDDVDISKPFAENKSSSSVSSKFFYSNDKFIDTFDDMQIYDTVRAQYPKIGPEYTDDKLKRKVVIDMLNNTAFIDEILEQYNMTILDFFKFLFRMCPSLFKGFFIKKI